MKKRKKKGETTPIDTEASAEATAPGASRSGEAITEAAEEPTAVNDAPVPELALRRSDDEPGDPLDVPIQVAEGALTEKTDLPEPPAARESDDAETPVVPTDLLSLLSDGDGAEETTAVAGLDEVAALAAKSVTHDDGERKPQGTSAATSAAGDADATGAPGADAAASDAGDGARPAAASGARLQSIIESLIFAADRPLGVGDLKRLVNERDTKNITAALEAIKARHQDTGIQLLGVAGGWQFRTHPENVAWVSKLLVGRPVRLSRAMLETLAIVAYRQPITRPEVDEIRGVDCGPVLKTLLERGLVRMIGKKEEVGRPLLYGTTPEFLRTFSLKDLAELPTLREFHELGAAEMAKVDAEAPRTVAAGAAVAGGLPTAVPAATELPAADPAEEDALLAELDSASAAAAQATKAREADDNPPAPAPDAGEA